jgi:hypothetical protein
MTPARSSPVGCNTTTSSVMFASKPATSTFTSSSQVRRLTVPSNVAGPSGGTGSSRGNSATSPAA